MKCACGCTDDRACEGGCFWVYTDEATGKGLCSRCVFEAIYNAAAGAPEDSRFDIAEQLVALADRVHPEYDGQVAQDEAVEAAFEAAVSRDGPPKLWLPGDPL